MSGRSHVFPNIGAVVLVKDLSYVADAFPQDDCFEVTDVRVHTRTAENGEEEDVVSLFLERAVPIPKEGP